jgi:hypothetical protein
MGVFFLKLSCSAGTCWLEVTDDAGVESPFIFESLLRSYELRLLPMLLSLLYLTFRSVTEIPQKSFCILASCSLWLPSDCLGVSASGSVV